MSAVLVEATASSIGELYRRAHGSHIESVQQLIECGQRLKAVKSRLPHGQWLAWIAENASLLGFGELTAQRLLKAAEASASLTTDLTPDKAAEINRRIWGNTPKAIAKVPREPFPQPTLPSDERCVSYAIDLFAQFCAATDPRKIEMSDHTRASAEGCYRWLTRALA